MSARDAGAVSEGRDCGWKGRAQPGDGESEGEGLSRLDGKGILHQRGGRKAARRLDHSAREVNRSQVGTDMGRRKAPA